MPKAEMFRLVSHGPPGSGPSRMLVALAAALAEAEPGIEATVVHLPEDDGASAILALAAAAGDPGVAGSCTPTYLTTPLKKHLPVRWSDLSPLGQLVADTYLLAVRAAAPWPDAREMLDEGAVCAAAGRGGNTHIQGLLLMNATGHTVPFAFFNSIPDAVDAVAGGAAGWTTGVASDFAREIAAGRLRVLANFADTDHGDASGVPLVKQGIDVSFPLWRGLMGPAGLTAGAVGRWERLLRAATGTAAWANYLVTNGVVAALTPAIAFRRLLDVEAGRYEAWFGAMGLKTQGTL